jgi:hypothetical protein
MAETIAPVVHGGRAHWLGSLALHTLGAAVTAATFGAVLGWSGRLLGAPWQRPGLLALTVVAALYAVVELTPLRMPVPQLRRQVPDWWRTFFGRPASAMLYGAGLGVGFLTYLAHGTLVVVSFAAVESGRPGVGALLLLPFGVVRGLSAVVAWGSSSQERSRTLVDRLVAAPASRRRAANGAALVLVAIASIGGASRAPSGSWWVLASASLAAVFAWAAASKVVGARAWRRSLPLFELPPAIDRAAVRGVPVAEAFVPVLVVIGLPRVAAGWAAVLILVFSGVIMRAGRSGGRISCGCFGLGGTARIGAALVRNAALAGLAMLVLVYGSDALRVAWPRMTAGDDVLPSLLAIGALMAAALTTWRTAVWLERGRRA